MQHTFTFTERSIPVIKNNTTTKKGNGTAGNDLVLELKKALPCK
jgi:hypothetical protein